MKKVNSRLIGWILLIIVLGALVLSSKIASGKSFDSTGKFGSNLIENKDVVMEKAKCFLQGEAACLAVNEKSGVNSEIKLYKLLDSKRIQITTPISLIDMTKKINDATIMIEVVHANDSNDLFLVGTYVSSNENVPQISDRAGTAFYVFPTADEGEKLERYVTFFYGMLQNYSSDYELKINNELVSLEEQKNIE